MAQATPWGGVLPDDANGKGLIQYNGRWYVNPQYNYDPNGANVGYDANGTPFTYDAQGRYMLPGTGNGVTQSFDENGYAQNVAYNADPEYGNVFVNNDPANQAWGRDTYGTMGKAYLPGDENASNTPINPNATSIGDPVAWYKSLSDKAGKQYVPDPNTAAGKAFYEANYSPEFGYTVPNDTMMKVVQPLLHEQSGGIGQMMPLILSMIMTAGAASGMGAGAALGEGAAAGGAGLAGDAFLPGALGADGGLASLGGLGASEFVTPELISQAVANGTLTAEQAAGLTSAAEGLGSGGTIQDLVNAYQNTVGQLPPGTTTGLQQLSNLGGNAAGDASLPGTLPSGAGDATMPGALGGSSAGNSLVTGAGAVPGDAYLPGALGSTLTPAESLAGATGAGYSWLDQLLSNVKSAVQKLLGTNGTGTSNLGTLGNIAAGGLDAYGIIQRNKDLKDIADRSWNAGAPSRARYEAGMSPDFDINNIPGYAQALQTSSDAFTRSLSAKNGNPAGNGAAQAETQKYLMGNLGIPAWNNYESLNSNAGGMSSLSSNANAAATNNATGASDLYNTLGKTVSNVTNPTSTVDELLAKLKQYGTGAATSSIFDALK